MRISNIKMGRGEWHYLYSTASFGKVYESNVLLGTQLYAKRQSGTDVDRSTFTTTNSVVGRSGPFALANRWLFKAPTKSTYEFELRAHSADDVVRPSVQIYGSGKSYLRVLRADISDAAFWQEPNELEMNRGGRKHILRRVWQPTGSGLFHVNADVEYTTTGAFSKIRQTLIATQQRRGTSNDVDSPFARSTHASVKKIDAKVHHQKIYTHLRDLRVITTGGEPPDIHIKVLIEVLEGAKVKIETQGYSSAMVWRGSK